MRLVKNCNLCRMSRHCFNSFSGHYERELKLRNVVTTKMLLESRFEWVFLLVKVNTTIKQHHLVFKEIDVRFILSR